MYSELLNDPTKLNSEGMVSMVYLEKGTTIEQRREMHLEALLYIAENGATYTERANAYTQFVYHYANADTQVMAKLLSSKTNNEMILRYITGVNPEIITEVQSVVDNWLIENEIKTPISDGFVERVVTLSTSSKTTMSTVVAQLQQYMSVEEDKTETKILVLCELLYALEETGLFTISTVGDVPYFKGNITLPLELSLKNKYASRPLFSVDVDTDFKTNSGKTRKRKGKLDEETLFYLNKQSNMPFKLNALILGMDQEIPDYNSDGEPLNANERDILMANVSKILTLGKLMQDRTIYFPVSISSNGRTYALYKESKQLRFAVRNMQPIAIDPKEIEMWENI